MQHHQPFHYTDLQNSPKETCGSPERLGNDCLLMTLPFWARYLLRPPQWASLVCWSEDYSDWLRALPHDCVWPPFPDPCQYLTLQNVKLSIFNLCFDSYGYGYSTSLSWFFMTRAFLVKDFWTTTRRFLFDHRSCFPPDATFAVRSAKDVALKSQTLIQLTISFIFLS